MSSYKKILNIEFSEDVSRDIAKIKVKELLTSQVNVYYKTYVTRSGDTVRALNLAQSSAKLESNGFSFDYPRTIQFLDLKYSCSKNGMNEKVRHAFIYNRYTYGHLYGNRKVLKKQLSYMTLIQFSIKNSMENILNKMEENDSFQAKQQLFNRTHS